MEDVTVAAIVMHCPVGETERNLQQTIRLARSAAEAGADIACFPELNLTGYCNRSELGRVAQPIPGPLTDAIAETARAAGIVILAGMAEKGDGDRVFASHGVFQPDGRIGVYRKLHVAPPEVDVFTPADAIPVFRTAGVTFGIQLCYDAHFPELSTEMAAAGADILFMPHASPRGSAESKHRSWMRHLTARAFDNSLFVVACNQTGENCKGLTFPGNAVVLNPSGNVMASALGGDETMLMVDLPAADLAHVRGHEMRYFFPNRRPELYRAGR